MSDWKPGTLAVITGVDGDVLAFRQERQWATLNHLYVNDWQLSEVRPLVVIDPEDMEAVERLAALYERDDEPGSIAIEQMQAALREFANPKPPRPDEPTGLGAVVEAINDNQFVRVGAAGWVHSENIAGNACDWEDIDVVRVLSEGVQP